MKRQKNGIWKVTDAEMNNFICMMTPASDWYAQVGCHALSRSAMELRQEIYDVLDGVGYYDDVEIGHNEIN